MMQLLRYLARHHMERAVILKRAEEYTTALNNMELMLYLLRRK